MAPLTETITERRPSATSETTSVVAKPNREAAPKSYKIEMVWWNVFKISLIHVIGIYGIYEMYYSKWQTHVFGNIILIFSGISVTAGAHRLWCHRAYKAKMPLRIFLMIFNCVAAQNDLYEWVRDHRVHHKYSETDADPHNVNRGFFFAHVGWLLCRKHPDVTEKGKHIDCSDIMRDPVARFQKQYYMRLVLLFSFILPTVLPAWLWGESYWNAFCTATMLRLILSLNFTWSVNSFAHLWGNKPFDKSISPTEAPWVSFVAVGEGFHNFHHTFPWDYSTSELGWKLNMSTMFIDIMAKLGQAYDLKVVSREAVLARKLRTGDGTRLPRRFREMAAAERESAAAAATAAVTGTSQG
ncbi:acyl-CoA desaturase-like [Dermacentor andersoni]|uniref:acyl-CoA desaturase-like n=1 Tax=Dermacentor andersoni TaxID=34620 RepID=UPI00241698DA|nr:acyl-CoA desaturase-like [Dermacentor andersoni]XP_054919126.1 acyl-CoA desaturase-like [Dermacentor andersoni]